MRKAENVAQWNYRGCLFQKSSMAEPSVPHSDDKTVLPSARTAILKSLIPLVSTQALAQLEGFVQRLSDALFKVAEQPGRSDEAEVALNAARHLNKNKTTFHRLISTCLTDALLREMQALDQPGGSRLEREAMDLTLVTFEAMEQKVLIDNLSQALDAANTEALHALHLRIAHLLQREEMVAGKNPFRPEVFLRAVFDAWCQFDLAGASHRVMLHQLRPEAFLSLEPIFQGLNAALVAHGILPKLTDAYRLRKSDQAAQKNGGEIARRNLPLYGKLNRWLSSPESSAGTSLHAGMPSPSVHPDLLDYLSSLQKNTSLRTPANTTTVASGEASILRQIGRQAPRGTLTEVDEKVFELLARMFDFLFREQHIPEEIKKLIGQLQIPLLKTALADKEFFFREDHPARRLVDTVAKSSVAWDQHKGHDDPLYKMIEQVVDRVQQEYDQQMALFDEAVTDLESFLQEEEKGAGTALSNVIAEALRQEKIHQARELAENNVVMRLETGEVAGFLEDFLKTQWTRVLGLAHMSQETRPDALPNAIKVMDDLIWSVQPKASTEERRELLNRLPSMLSLLNAWLNVIKWEGPERVAFFSKLAERQAAVVRMQGELSPRHQLEITMNVAQKASERRLNKRASESKETMAADAFVYLVDRLEPGVWVALTNREGKVKKNRLAWISPNRSRFVFAGRQGSEPFIRTFDEVAQLFRQGAASVVAADLVLDRAMMAVLEETPA